MLLRLAAITLAITVAALVVVLFSPPAHAQNAASGAVYNRSFPATCSDRHGTDPRADPYASSKSGGVRMGANRPDLMVGAITTPGAYTRPQTSARA